ncbi:hypothetical protein F6R98_14635 [Candidatus Methylospira mobilis]|uniref:Uncharacterized protein n=1 Tax=Candidatus Methylospira mobilis TaxID=1808979 RepID=A0A5Q0BIR0_9GAMM|nr:hypothetical protein [Candidatus Methylospira mobilis]QFY43710.1 hypothetical protein F6R98_14635 [Candidatus Methylospira mobilis]
MDWASAKKLIESEIVQNTDINTNKSEYRIVKSIDEEVITVQVGELNYIKVTWEMLENCFKPISLGEKYDGNYFREHFPEHAKNHPCYVHVVGQIFVKSGVAIEQSEKYIEVIR